ncbi:MAG: hypothetical protein M3Z95_01190, partial [Actinomycetota bacterium]|nr:hypothetical protein [Actinomycetota bacterium]
MATIRFSAISRHVLRSVVMALAGACALLLLPAPLAAAAEESSATYDKPGVQHDEHCVEGLGGAKSATGAAKAVVVRDLEGNPLQTLKGPLGLDPPNEQLACEAVKTNGLLIQGIESVQSNGLTLYFVWTPSGAQYDGFVSGSELAAAPPVNNENAAGNGVAAPPAPGEPVYTVAPEDMWANGNPHELWYPGASDTKERYDYAPYGRPAAGALYSLMTWSWIDVSGGGIGRATISAGTRFFPAGVQPIHSTTYN